jgi:hypothetical protein
MALKRMPKLIPRHVQVSIFRYEIDDDKHAFSLSSLLTGVNDD